MTLHLLSSEVYMRKVDTEKHYFLTNTVGFSYTRTYVYCTLSLHATRKILGRVYIYCTLDTVQN